MHTFPPNRAGLSSARLERITHLFQGYVDRGDIAGAAATVSRNCQTVYTQAVGWADVETHRPLKSDAIYRIASMTKPITSVAAMLLYEEGHFNLNTPVEKFIPEFKNLKVFVRESEGEMEVEDLDIPVTMRHLFTHTSGLVYGSDPNHPIDRRMQEEMKKYQDKEPSMQEAVENLVTIPLAFQPGTKWRYGFNIEVLGRIIEIISGQPLDEFMRQRIFEPLSMPDTGFFVTPENGSRVPTLYGHPDGPGPLKRLSDEFATKPPRFLSGGGGLFSSLPDYARFCEMLVNQGELDGVRLLSPSTLRMYSTNYAPEQALPYGFAPKNDLYHLGYGFSLATRVLMDPSKTGMAGSVGEFGWDGAFNTYFWVDPSEKLFGLMMLQHHPNAFFPIAPQFKQLTYQAILS